MELLSLKKKRKTSTRLDSVLSVIVILLLIAVTVLSGCSSDVSRTSNQEQYPKLTFQETKDIEYKEAPLVCGPDGLKAVETEKPSATTTEEPTKEEPSGPSLPTYTGPTRFQILSDIHISNGTQHCLIMAQDNFDNILSEINANCPMTSGIIATGDFTVFGDQYEYDNYWNTLSYHGFSGSRNVTASGNHEFFQAGTKSGYDEYWNRFKTNLGIDKMYYDTWINDSHVVVLGSDQIPADWCKASYSQEQLAWLEQKLATDKAAGRTTFVVGHQCLTGTVSNVQSSVPYIAEDKQMKEILSKYPNALFFTGDTHRQFQSNVNVYRIEEGALCVHSGAVTGVNDTTGQHKLHAEYLDITVNSNRSTTISFFDSTCQYEVDSYTYEW